jgi:hypothetical protein
MKSRYCSLCGTSLEGVRRAFRRVSRAGSLSLCADCAAQSRRCIGCGDPIVGILSYGEPACPPLCAECRGAGITDSAAAQQIYDQIAAIAERDLGLRVYRRPVLVLASAQEMARLETWRKPAHTVVPPGAMPLIGLYVKEGARRTIYALSGLPRSALCNVIAHEYAHAWQAENAPFLREAWLLEGFCEWVAYRTLHALGMNREAERLVATGDFYGEALAAVLEIEAAQGVAGVIRAARAVVPAAGSVV